MWKSQVYKRQAEGTSKGRKMDVLRACSCDMETNVLRKLGRKAAHLELGNQRGEWSGVN